jgi:hypothetical protein
MDYAQALCALPSGLQEPERLDPLLGQADTILL